MTYWLVNSGTTEDPLSSEPGAVHSAFVNWDREQGPVHGLDRAYKMRPGDILIYRTVGMPVSRLVAAAELEQAPVEKAFLRWRYQVRREVFALVDTLRNAPAFDLLEVPPVRVTKRLDAQTGEQAVGLIRRNLQEVAGQTYERGLPGQRLRTTERGLDNSAGMREKQRSPRP